MYTRGVGRSISGRGSCALLLAWSILAAARLGRAEVGYDLSAELGPELDSNATRQPSTDGDEEVRAGLFRIVADGKLTIRGGRHRLALAYGGGAKLFASERARSADEVVQRARASWGWLSGKRRSFWLLGGYYDAYQRESRQDFRTGTATTRVALASAGGTVGSLDLGYQGLEFKPFDDYSFHGLAGAVSLATRVVPDRADEIIWRLGVSYGLALRSYNGPVLGEQRRDPCAEEPDSPTCGEHRRDLSHTVRVWAAYSGNAVARLWYGLELNGSNSFGETFTRHAVGIRFTTLLGGGIYLTTKGVLRFSSFRDPFLVLSSSQTRFVDIDDENRSTLVLRLGRDLTDRWGLALRYSLHVNESSGGQGELRSAGFLRHLLFLGVRVRVDSGE